MANLTIRNLDPMLKSRLRVRAAQNGHSMEQEARDILHSALKSRQAKPRSLVQSIRSRMTPLGGVDFPEFPRQPVRPPPTFE